MAGDWIKMRLDLPDDPAVVGIAAALGLEEDTVVGKLHRLWSWADRHTADGTAPGITAPWVDRHVSCPGFADAMVAVGWLRFTDRAIVFPAFDKHNGATAKRRADNAMRQALSRIKRDKVVTKARQSCDKSATREEKRREEKSNKDPPTPQTGGVEAVADIPDLLREAGFLAAWSRWQDYRRERRRPLTPSTRASQLAFLEKLGPGLGADAIEVSIRNGWQGLFPPRDGPGGGGNGLLDGIRKFAAGEEGGGRDTA